MLSKVIVFHNNRVFNDLSPEAGLAIFIVTASAGIRFERRMLHTPGARGRNGGIGEVVAFCFDYTKKAKKKNVTNFSQSTKLNTCCLAHPIGKSTCLVSGAYCFKCNK